MMPATIAVHLAVSAWLVYLAAADLRRGEVSNWATVPPLLAVVAWRSLTGGWPLALALALVLVLAGAQWPWFSAASVGLLVACAWPAAQAGLDVTVGVWALVYVLWQTGVIGGADAKTAMALVAAFPDGRLVWLLLLCWFGLSVVHLLRRHGRRVPRALMQATQAMAGLEIPEGSRCPALPAVALAGLVYVWAYL
jgi:Flp pilus assembly protein protease CpaA